jgi:hypothetical protein
MNRLRFVTLSVLLLLALPLLGVMLAGKPVGDYVEFPPRTRYIDQAPFSWPVFGGLAVAILASLAPFLLRIVRCASCSVTLSPHGKGESEGRAFPWWGWLGALWVLTAWTLAWTRWSWMESFQTWTFTPLWLGYILLVNALTVMRGGTSVMLERPARFAALFPVSTAFWWLFEYLNRFVQNWYYSGAAELSALDYVVQASIPFSTVLPAVVSTYHLLATVPRLWGGLERGPAWQVREPRAWALAALLVAACGLLGLGLWPNVLFPLVWVAPPVLIVSAQVLSGRPTIFEPLGAGDWRPLWTAAVAALVCGVFWELWNWRSLAHWSYTIPYVDRFHVFAMPLLGYAGYLPFGLECLVVADLVLTRRGERPIVAQPFA